MTFMLANDLRSKATIGQSCFCGCFARQDISHSHSISPMKRVGRLRGPLDS
jgi:hypothetical protein